MPMAVEGKALSDDEIVKVWAAAADLGAFGGRDPAWVLTGLRRNEIATSNGRTFVTMPSSFRRSVRKWAASTLSR